MKKTQEKSVGKSIEHKSKLVSLSKYRSIIILVMLFLIFDVSILALNYYQSFKVSVSALEINIASRQASLAQDIAKSITDINLIAERDHSRNGIVDNVALRKDVFKQFDALQHSTKLFNESLKILTNGGVAQNSEGQSIPIKAIDIPSAQDSLESIVNIWTPYQGLLEKFITTYEQNSVNISNIQFATDYARIYTRNLIVEADSVASDIQQQAENQANILRIIQIIGIIIAVTIFFLIVFRALRALLRSDLELALSRRETMEIMSTIQEGLFLINQDYIIGEQQSSKLGDIFPVKDISGKKFDDILEGVVPEQSIVNTKRFIAQLFNRKVRENLINDLNPLRRVPIQYKKEDGTYSQNYLSFHFMRSYEGKKINHVLVSITDITMAVELELRLQKEREQTEVQFEMLMQLLRIEPRTLDHFMNNATNMSHRINGILRSSSRSQHELSKKVESIFREVHGFKGDASGLALEGFVDIAEDMEESLNKLREKRNLSGNDFLNITMALDKFFGLIQDIQGMRDRLVNLDLSKDEVQHDTPVSLTMYFRQFAEQIAKRNNKKVNLNVEGFDNIHLDIDTVNKVKEVSTQLLRNAIVHGIEMPQDRLAAGKHEVGLVKMVLSQQEGNWQILFEDDGGGIRKDAIRTKLVDSGRYTAEQAAELGERELYRAIFLPGLSTQTHSTEDAGRGVGMDIVKDRIIQLNGKIDIRSTEGQYSRFIIRFSSKNNNDGVN